jgi:hypothetical protein
VAGREEGMSRPVAALSVVLAVVATLVAVAHAQQHSLPCHVLGSAAFTAPDNACTPGAYRVLSRSAVCSTKDRPTLPAADRRKVVSEYGVPRWSGANGELDHRVPLFLGGLTVENNIWPERGGIPNRKDALENLVRRRICVDRTMRVRTGVRIFLSDWRHAYRTLVAPLSAAAPLVARGG